MVAERGSTGPGASTQVSLEPPPWLEFTTSEPRRSATRVRPPGMTSTRSPLTTNGRRSMWRPSRWSSTSVGCRDRATTSWAMKPRGSASMLRAVAASSSSVAEGPMHMP